MRQGKPTLGSLWKALDEASFGPDRILNLRDSLPSAPDARARAELWLRCRQVMNSAEVLIITGRGNQSHGRVGVIRREVESLLALLKRRGVVSAWREHNPGAFVVHPASMTVLLDSPRRCRGAPARPEVDPPSLAGLGPETANLLRQLAIQNIEQLGVSDTLLYIEREMLWTFSALVRAIPAGADREAHLREALRKALNEVSE